MSLTEFDKAHLAWIIKKFTESHEFIICAHCEMEKKCFKKDGITLKQNTYCDTFRRKVLKELKLEDY